MATRKKTEVASAPSEEQDHDAREQPEHPATAAEEVSVSEISSDPVPSTGAKVAPAKKSAPKRAKDPHKAEFLVEQRALLIQERASYTKQAEELKAEADSLALEHEPGDVQFDEEGGEGGTSNVDRELDLVLSAQARGAVVEIDRALAKIDSGNYGMCEQCGQPIPQARLKALPYASLCVGCKSGGLSRR
jgi:DnaK suppressor protein